MNEITETKPQVLFNINTNIDKITVSARELYKFLEITDRYSRWFERMLDYDFTENLDYTSVKSSTLVNNGAQREIVDHQLTIEMAKEIAMLQRNEKGKQARQYFIQLEKEWNSPERVMQRALILANQEIDNLKLLTLSQEQIISEMKSKVDYTNIILQNKELILTTAIAKDYGMSGEAFNRLLKELKIQYKIGNQWFLYSQYQSRGWTSSETKAIPLKDGRTKVVMNTKWTQKGRLALYEVLKNNGILPTIEREDK